MRFNLRLLPVALVVAAFSFHSLARESCNPKELNRRITVKTKFPSLIYDCQQDFSAAKKCCLHPETCGKTAFRETLSEAGAIFEYKKMKERELQKCEVRIKAAKRSCQNDQERLAVLGREFNDILRCGDDHLAKLNGQVIKSASENRYAYEDEQEYGEAPESKVRAPAAADTGGLQPPASTPPAEGPF